MSRFPAGSTRARGQWSEDLAVEHLRTQGIEIIDRNVEAAGAELDVIARASDGTIVFVEVRSRGHDARGRPEETVDRRKRAQLRRCATAWLVARDLWERVAVRFDVIAVLGGPNDEAPEITWIAGAFDADE